MRKGVNHAFSHPLRVGVDFVKKGAKPKAAVVITAEKAQAGTVQEAKNKYKGYGFALIGVITNEFR